MEIVSISHLVGWATEEGCFQNQQGAIYGVPLRHLGQDRINRHLNLDIMVTVITIKIYISECSDYVIRIFTNFISNCLSSGPMSTILMKIVWVLLRPRKDWLFRYALRVARQLLTVFDCHRRIVDRVFCMFWSRGLLNPWGLFCLNELHLYGWILFLCNVRKSCLRYLPKCSLIG